MKRQKKLESVGIVTALRGKVTYEASSLRSAEIILADREKYDRPDARFMIRWAELVVARLEGRAA